MVVPLDNPGKGKLSPLGHGRRFVDICRCCLVGLVMKRIRPTSGGINVFRRCICCRGRGRVGGRHGRSTRFGGKVGIATCRFRTRHPVPTQLLHQHGPSRGVGRVQTKCLLKRIARVVAVTSLGNVRAGQPDVSLGPSIVEGDALLGLLHGGRGHGRPSKLQPTRDHVGEDDLTFGVGNSRECQGRPIRAQGIVIAFGIEGVSASVLALPPRGGRSRSRWSRSVPHVVLSFLLS